MEPAHLIILAAGKGTRMKSDIPKVLTPYRTTTLIEQLLKNTHSEPSRTTIVIGFKGNQVKQHLGNDYSYAWQTEQRGTGHAVLAARELLEHTVTSHDIIVLYGDCPSTTAATLTALQQQRHTHQATMSVATAVVPNYNPPYDLFNHYGRIIRNNNNTIDRIVEYRDANTDQQAITEVNLGWYCFDASWLWTALEQIDDHNAAGELYLTDLVHIAITQNKTVAGVPVRDPFEGVGVNKPEELHTLTALQNQS